MTTLAKVASNAYIRIPETDEWYDIGKHWNESNDFGWEEHGLRGHVFANKDNSTIIVAMKGTSPPFVGGSDTATNDKINVPPPLPSPSLPTTDIAGVRTTSYSPVAVPVYPTSGPPSATVSPATPTNAT